MARAGFKIVHSERFNRLGAIGWWVSGKVFRRRRLSPRQMIWFDRIVPLARMLDSWLPVPGVSLIIVGKKNA